MKVFMRNLLINSQYEFHKQHAYMYVVEAMLASFPGTLEKVPLFSRASGNEAKALWCIRIVPQFTRFSMLFIHDD